jgi:hypothetical protein
MPHKALLVGASAYREPAIPSLPFVPEDLRRLQSALFGRGFAAAEILEAAPQITRSDVLGRVARFLRLARRDDVLLIVLSGHGHHFEGADYLIPEDAVFDIEPFADACVEIGWNNALDDCPARQVVFLIDACREGFARDSKGPSGVQKWSTGKTAAAGRRNVARVYACSPAQVALFVRPTESPPVGGVPGDSFSLFSRALTDVVEHMTAELDLAELQAEVQTRIDALHTTYGKTGAVQQVRVTADADPRTFTALPGPARRPRTHPWVRSVEHHAVWDRVSATTTDDTREALTSACATLAGELAVTFERHAAALDGDPWLDTELAERVQARMDFLVGHLARAVRLSPSEAALTTLLPLIEQTHWAASAVSRLDVLRSGPGVAAPLDVFTRAHPRLLRRLHTLENGGDPGGQCTAIRWWLYHRWLLQQTDLYGPPALTLLLKGWPERQRTSGNEASTPWGKDWFGDTLSPGAVSRFLRAHRIAPYAVDAEPDLAWANPVAATTREEHTVCEPVVAALVKTAYALAVDPLDMSETVVEHLGTSDPVDLAGMVATLRASAWHASGVGRTLKADCGHPAVRLALRDHARATDHLLRDINRSAVLKPLHSLPPFADAGQVRLTGNTPHHLPEGIRFHLAEDRVQELLVGESLYGRRTLAIRELYQNALDALRYREARHTFLRGTSAGFRSRDGGWKGTIDFIQGADADGRPYLECRDNGIGMGVHELSSVFAQGGARFVDLPEFVEEQTAWAALDPPVTVYPNSRFGIGVLSYFMLADEIEVRTCRLGRDGTPGRGLRVTIAGPGNLFRIADLGPGDDAGTTVRLWMSPDTAAKVSCVDALTEVLAVAPFRTTARHGIRQFGYAPGVLRAETVEQVLSRRRVSTDEPEKIAATDNPDLWWTSGQGLLLADGLITENEPRFLRRSDAPDLAEALPHLIVNLRGPHQPKLTVDRRFVRSYDVAYVERAASDATDALVRDARSLLTRDWLSELGPCSLTIADALAESASSASVQWTVAGHTMPFGAVGAFALDELLAPAVTGTGAWSPSQRANAAAFVHCVPDPVLRWRLRALCTAIPNPEAPFAAPSAGPTALPSDVVLLRADDQPFTLPEYWLRGPVGADRPWRLGAGSATTLPRWRAADFPVSLSEVMTLAYRCEKTAEQIADRFTRLGFETVPLARLGQAGPSDVPLLVSLNRECLHPGSRLSHAQIAFSAAMADVSTTAAAERLADLGFVVPSGYPAIDRWQPRDRQLLRGLFTSYEDIPNAPQLREVSRAHLVSLAHRDDRPLPVVAALLRDWGFDVLPDAEAVEQLSDEDRVLLDAAGHTLTVDVPVPLWHLLNVTAETGSSLAEAAERLTQLGYVVPAPPPILTAKLADSAALLRGAEFHHLAWESAEKPLSLPTVAQLVKASGRPFSTVVRALHACGYHQTLDLETLGVWPTEDMEALAQLTIDPERESELSQSEVHAVATHVRRPPARVAADLVALGFRAAPPDPALDEELRAELVLERVLTAQPQGPASVEDDAVAPFTGVVGRPLPLRSLTAVALRTGHSLGAVARTASKAGLRHHAESWFGAPQGA